MVTKTKEEIQAYLRKTGMFSFNGVLDDFIFGEGDEWYYTKDTKGPDEHFEGPFKTYDEAETHWNAYFKKHWDNPFKKLLK